MSVNIVFVYYRNMISETVHRSDPEDRDDTLCGASYALETPEGEPAGEFLHSDDSAELSQALRSGVDIRSTNCKRCLKKLAKAGRK